MFDWTCLVVYSLYIGLFLLIPVHYILAENYPIVTRIIILIEQVEVLFYSKMTRNRREQTNFISEIHREVS